MTTTASEMGPPPTDLPGDDNPAASDPSSSNDGATAPAAPDTALVEEMPPPPPRDAGQKPPIVPYTVPEWSGPPCHSYTLEVLKDGSIVDQLSVSEKGAYMFGRVDLCDFVLEHPTISRFHAVLQFKRSGDAYIYDTGSTHGTVVNKKQVEKRVHVELHVGDVIRFGQSSRLYILQGPPDLMPPETDLKILKEAKIRQAVFDREASLRRAKAEASIADGISWGMVEDAIEDVEDDDGDEITWQTYRGQLTEKQEKTREKILKRTEKIAHMKKEIDAIRAKDIAQGGLTQGQQTQIARNELRITQLMEELENLEETLNESIRESLGARGEKRHGKTKGATEDDEYLSDEDDEFYDRTKKPSRQKAGENQAVETADTLLDKKDAITKEIENKKESLLIEKGKNESDTEARTESKDSLDDFMSGVSSQLVLDKTTKLEEELSALQSELDRIFFLLRIADPSGEAANKRENKMQVKRDCVNAQVATSKRQPQLEPQKISESKKSVNVSEKEQRTSDAELSGKQEPKKIVTDTTENQKTVYTVVKPQWLGAVDDMKIEEIKPEEPSHKPEEPSNLDKYDQFVDYKDRQKVLSGGVQGTVGSEIESAAPGLIVRKRKEKEEPPTINHEAAEHLGQSSGGAEFVAEDVVALLLKHKRGYHGDEDGLESQNQEGAGEKQSRSNNKKPKRVLGPEKPSFLQSPSDDESWLPPEGQSGDGRTSLNERYGY